MPGTQAGTSHAVEEYLEAIHKCGASAGGVSTTRLAEQLQVAPASVTGMLRRLSRDGLVAHRRYGEIALTAEGDRRAHELIKRHRLAERLLTDMLKVPLAEAHEEACRLEHALSPELEARLEQALGSPEACPHGHPVDVAARDCTRALLEVPVGHTVTIARLEDERPEIVRYLAERKLLPGARVEIQRHEALGTVVVVEVEGKQHDLSSALAAGVRVERW
jgi:DtxR family Mn-dependent transcriptional regulator